MAVVQQLEHAADYFVGITAADTADLFTGGLQAVAAYCVAQPDELRPNDITISELCVVQADCLEELFVRFLNEVLYKMDEQNAVFFDMSINAVSDTNFDAVLHGVSRRNIAMEGEIKSATYHNLTIEHVMSGIRATVLFDV